MLMYSGKFIHKTASRRHKNRNNQRRDALPKAVVRPWAQRTRTSAVDVAVQHVCHTDMRMRMHAKLLERTGGRLPRRRRLLLPKLHQGQHQQKAEERRKLLPAQQTNQTHSEAPLTEDAHPTQILHLTHPEEIV